MIPMIKIIYKRFSRFLIWLWRQEGTPSQRARGLAAGIFSGCFPLFGLQTIFGIFLARIIKGNYLLAITGTWISNPFTYVPIYWFNYKVGCLILDQKIITLNFNTFNFADLLSNSYAIIARMLFGSFFVGTFLGSVVGVLAYLLFRNFRLSSRINLNSNSSISRKLSK